MVRQVGYFKSLGRHLEAKRLEDRVTYDLEMIRELGYCSGIENYSRYFDGRDKGARPFCLLDYFPDDYFMVINESHVTVPQIRAMYGGDRSRKQNLVEYGFRLPAAMDNRPLTFDEFDHLFHQVIFVSATPAEYELGQSEGIVVEQVIRPTGLLDPVIEVRPAINQVDDLLHEIQEVIKRDPVDPQEAARLERWMRLREGLESLATVPFRATEALTSIPAYQHHHVTEWLSRALSFLHEFDQLWSQDHA